MWEQLPAAIWLFFMISIKTVLSRQDAAPTMKQIETQHFLIAPVKNRLQCRKQHHNFKKRMSENEEMNHVGRKKSGSIFHRWERHLLWERHLAAIFFHLKFFKIKKFHK